MKLRVVDSKAFYAGLFYVVVGGAALVLAQQYVIGKPLNMGPGFFPALIGAVLLLLGVTSLVQGVRATERVEIDHRKNRPVIFVLLGVISFALLVERAGLLVAIGALLFFACFDRLRTKPVEVVVVYVLLAGFSAGLFVYGLGMPIPLVWWE